MSNTFQGAQAQRFVDSSRSIGTAAGLARSPSSRGTRGTITGSSSSAAPRGLSSFPLGTSESGASSEPTGVGARTMSTRRGTDRDRRVTMPRESVVLAQILAYLETRGDVFVWRNNTGVAEIGNNRVRFGLKGSSDIIGLQAPSGRFVGIEVKRSVGGRLSAGQIRWLDEIRRRGGIGAVAACVEDVRQALGPPTVRIPNSGRRFPGATVDCESDPDLTREKKA